jgi:hypothetical protein
MRKARVAPVMAVDIAPWVSNVLTIGGQDYRGPTAAQLPAIIVDWLLWGCDVDDPGYRDYFRYYFAEQPSHRRRDEPPNRGTVAHDSSDARSRT